MNINEPLNCIINPVCFTKLLEFASQQHETLQVIANDLNTNIDPELIYRSAEFFPESIKHTTYPNSNLSFTEKKQFEKSLSVIRKHRISVIDNFAYESVSNKEYQRNIMKSISFLFDLNKFLKFSRNNILNGFEFNFVLNFVPFFPFKMTIQHF